MTQEHTHTSIVEGCYRCELSADEVEARQDLPDGPPLQPHGAWRPGGVLPIDKLAQPTAPGWYAYTGGTQTLIFNLRQTGSWSENGRQWSAHADNGSATDCHWEYIEQALDAFGPLRRIA